MTSRVHLGLRIPVALRDAIQASASRRGLTMAAFVIVSLEEAAAGNVPRGTPPPPLPPPPGQATITAVLDQRDDLAADARALAAALQHLMVALPVSDTDGYRVAHEALVSHFMTFAKVGIRP